MDYESNIDVSDGKIIIIIIIIKLEVTGEIQKIQESGVALKGVKWYMTADDDSRWMS